MNKEGPGPCAYKNDVILSPNKEKFSFPKVRSLIELEGRQEID